MKFLMFILISLVSGCNYMSQSEPVTKIINTPSPITSPSPTPFTYYNPPELEAKEVYWVALMGDSMTEALGPHGGPMTEKLNALYEPYGRDILVDNYAVGSTNITNADIRLRETTNAREWVFEPILKRPELDLIIIESFAYNPLSHISDRQAALNEQDRLLTQLMTDITRELPNTKVAFMATIAPSRINFAQNSSGLSNQESKIQADERLMYLENHIAFALEHNIPLINIYQQSLSPDGDGEIKYINPTDYIHPSHEGIELISKTMAEFIYEESLLPK